jgi:hypothetical protein
MLIFNTAILGPALLIASPWFYIAYRFTHNPIFPLFENFNIYAQLNQVEANYYSLTNIIQRIILLPIQLTFPYNDFISPIIGIMFFLIIWTVIKNSQIRKITLLAVLGAVSIQFLAPPSSRYLLVYLPAIAISTAFAIHSIKSEQIKKYFFQAIFISSLIILIARIGSLNKYFPYLSKQQNLNQFLTSQAQRLPNTFIDSNNFITENISPNSKILIDKLHNLYYFPFDFDHTSWLNPKTKYDYLITQDTNPENINGTLIHTNSLGIQVYKLP